MLRHRKLFGLVLVIFFLYPFALVWADEQCTEVYGNSEKKFSLATGSPGELGLLKVLADEFNRVQFFPSPI